MKDFFATPALKYGLTTRTSAQLQEDAAVKVALAALIRSTTVTLPAVRESRIVELLNTISLAYSRIARRSKSSSGGAVVFDSNNISQTKLKSYLGSHDAPAFFAYSGAASDLDARIAHRTAQPWPVLLCVGDDGGPWDGDADVGDRLCPCLRTLRRYRPDLSTVYGFFVGPNSFALVSLNACETRASARKPWSDIAAWVALVAAMYHTMDKRNDHLTYRGSELGFPLWDVSYGHAPFAAVPFHAGTAPGRATLAAFELGSTTLPDEDAARQFCGGEVEGFFKISWQDKYPPPGMGESALLAYLHKDAWIPGLVRPRYTARHSKLAITQANPPQHQVCKHVVPDTIHLGSIGEPLSQAVSPRHLLYAAYDIIETHLHMCERNVLHRDLSWFNCLIFPRHYVGVDGTKPEASRPCVSRIMNAASVEVGGHGVRLGRKTEVALGEDPFEPCALITDLDHAIKLNTLKREQNLIRFRNTDVRGTPGFVALSLNNPTVCVNQGLPIIAMSHLLSALAEAESTDRGRSALAAAFPSGDDDFVVRATAILTKELTRMCEDDPYAGVVEMEPKQDARHDCESVFWSLALAFCQARPLGSEPEGRGDQRAFDFKFLFDAITDPNVSDLAADYQRVRFFNSFRWRKHSPLHPSLDLFSQLLANMATYLSIPWHLYTSSQATRGFDLNHTHTAFRRLILGYLLRDENASSLDIPLDTERPRFAVFNDRPVSESEEMCANSQSITAADFGTSDVEGTPVSRTTMASEPRKRKRDGGDGGDYDDEQSPQRSKARADAGDAGPGSPERSTAAASSWDSRSISALTRKFKTDKLWFGQWA
ncbi:hypothetical protein EXIGLDRAFT_725068 [Exidia glandulosa HHB12029]|uniref:Fungal-type protein kinase domain-containing protein n=1 Tax=Exidia glandulosa HHB12029 TaxID=1314781 RepID=A0A165E7K3_EXIGL|nr:hypothetical protein EXIGLDRAFT_725068 [Exidia glandulosa HHB12029]